MTGTTLYRNDWGPPATITQKAVMGFTVGRRLWRRSDGREFVITAMADETDWVSLQCAATGTRWSLRRGDLLPLMSQVKLTA